MELVIILEPLLLRLLLEEAASLDDVLGKETFQLGILEPNSLVELHLLRERVPVLLQVVNHFRPPNVLY